MLEPLGPQPDSMSWHSNSISDDDSDYDVPPHRRPLAPIPEPARAPKQSDHRTVLAFPPGVAYHASLPPPSMKLVRSGRLDNTVRALEQVDFDCLLPTLRTDPQTVVSGVYSAINGALDSNQPLRVASFRNDKEWMTLELKELVKLRQRALKTGNDALRVHYATRFCNAAAARKRIYYREKYSADIRKRGMWQHLESIRAPTRLAQIDPEFGRRLTSQFSEEVWRGIDIPDLRRFITARLFPHDDDLTRARHSDFCSRPPRAFPLCTFANVAEQFRLIRSCTPGPDGICGRLLFAARDTLVPILTAIFNYCLEYSWFPLEWCGANIIPIPKISNPSEPADFRPIALTSAVSKMLERIVAKFIISHTSELWRSNKQFGFLPGRSTADAILKVIDDFGYAHDSHTKLLGIFFDFAKAFDLVNHEILLTKLQSKRLLPDWLLSWIAAYLSHRWQRVTIDSDSNAARRIRAGVIQGSVLGPVLFLLFIADIDEFILRAVPNCALLKYADDILAYVCGKNIDSLPQAIVDAVNEWCRINKMKLNTTKCKVIAIRCPPADRPLIRLNNTALEYVESYKYLGIEINTKMSADMQWDRVLSRVKSVPFLIKQLKLNGWSTSMLITAYHAHGLSHFTYSAPILTSCTKRAKNQMNSLQNRVLRAIGISQPTATTRYNILPIEKRIDDICMRTLERILGDSEHLLHSNLTTNERGSARTRRARGKLYNESFLVKFMRQHLSSHRRRFTSPTS